MDENFDKQKIIELLFDSDVSVILSELEDGDKDSSYLAEKLQLTEDEIQKRLSYLIEHGFVESEREGGKIVYAVDKEKLSQIMENDDNFSSVTKGLTELDSYLN